MRKETVDNDPLGLVHESAKLMDCRAPRTPAPQASEEQRDRKTR